MPKRLILLSTLFLVAGLTPISAQTRCSQVLEQYRTGQPPKAYAVSATNSACGFATARSASSLAQARAKALEYCRSAGGGTGCKVELSQAK